MIHPSAIVHPEAILGDSCEIGPYAVIDAHVRLGPRCKVGPHVHLTGHTEIGANNCFYTGSVIGEAPQDLKYKDAPTRLRVGDGNTFREHVTVHRSNKLEEDTVVGSNNFLMAHSHLGHNCLIGDNNILANGALVAGHVSIQDRVFISGNCLVHQFVRIGSFALMQGGSAISKDLPPYTIARGDNHICGLNIIGLRRAGFTPAQRLEIKQLYKALFRSRLRRAEALAAAETHFKSELAREFIAFVRSSKRGLCSDVSKGNSESDSEGDSGAVAHQGAK